MTTRPKETPRRIIVVVVPPIDELDLVGPLQVFNSVNRLARKTMYTIEVVTNADHLTVEGEGGVVKFLARHHFNKVEGLCDSVLLVCGVGTRSVRDTALFAWLRKMSVEVRRMGAVCAAALLFAEARLLNGRRATAHWKFAKELAARHPKVRVERDPIWVKDGNIYTSAGLSAGIDRDRSVTMTTSTLAPVAAATASIARSSAVLSREPSARPHASVPTRK